MSSGVRATESSESRRGYLDLDTHLEFRRAFRTVCNERIGWRITLEIEATTGVDEWQRCRFYNVPEPWQAPA